MGPVSTAGVDFHEPPLPSSGVVEEDRRESSIQEAELVLEGVFSYLAAEGLSDRKRPCAMLLDSHHNRGILQNQGYLQQRRDRRIVEGHWGSDRAWLLRPFLARKKTAEEEVDMGRHSKQDGKQPSDVRAEEEDLHTLVGR